MRKLFIAAVVVAAPFTMASSCDKSSSVTSCKPHSVRQDIDKANRVWICNNNGTGETPVDNPNTTHNWG